MIYKIYGALLLTVGFGSVGFIMNHKRRQELSMLQQLYSFLDNLICELRYRQIPLCQLVQSAGSTLNGEVHRLLAKFTSELEAQIAPDATSCMNAVLSSCNYVPASIRNVLRALGQSFGRYDIEGQIRCLEAIQLICKKDYTNIEDKLGNNTRCCQAYALGAGAILALILL